MPGIGFDDRMSSFSLNRARFPWRLGFERPFRAGGEGGASLAELHGPRKPAARHPPAAESRARRRGAARACHTSGPLLHRTRHGHRDAAVSSSRPEFRRDCIGVGITLRFICVDRSSHTSGHESRARTQLGRYTVCRRTVARAPTGTCYEIHTYPCII